MFEGTVESLHHKISTTVKQIPAPVVHGAVKAATKVPSYDVPADVTRVNRRYIHGALIAQRKIKLGPNGVAYRAVSHTEKKHASV